MALSAERLQKEAKEDPNKLAEAFCKTLIDFGYGGLAKDIVRVAIDKYLEGEQPSGIIQMFVHRWLKEGME